MSKDLIVGPGVCVLEGAGGGMFSGLESRFLRDTSLSFYSRFYKAYNRIYPGLGYSVVGGVGAGQKRVLDFFFQKFSPTPSPK